MPGKGSGKMSSELVKDNLDSNKDFGGDSPLAPQSRYVCLCLDHRPSSPGTFPEQPLGHGPHYSVSSACFISTVPVSSSQIHAL